MKNIEISVSIKHYAINITVFCLAILMCSSVNNEPKLIYLLTFVSAMVGRFSIKTFWSMDFLPDTVLLKTLHFINVVLCLLSWFFISSLIVRGIIDAPISASTANVGHIVFLIFYFMVNILLLFYISKNAAFAHVEARQHYICTNCVWKPVGSYSNKISVANGTLVLSNGSRIVLAEVNRRLRIDVDQSIIK